MADSALANAIKETKAVLQPLFTKPRLATKLLTKPPFPFIHDVITATIKATGFPEGYFTPEELEPANFKDKKSLRAPFLDKLIHLVNVANGSPLEVRASKIAAGLEPSHTNVLLATFGRIAQDEKISRRDLIEHCLSGKSIDEYRDRNRNQKQGASKNSYSKNAAAGQPERPMDEISNQPTKDRHAIQSEKTPPEENANSRRSDETTPKEDSIRDQNVADGLKEGTHVASSPTSLKEKIKDCNEDIDQTRQMISAIATKTKFKCSDKVLSKPPFKFLHDVIMAIGNAMKFDLERIFSEDEMVYANLNEKQPRIEFFEKLIHFLEKELDMHLNVKAIKITSGREPERTRYLLQIFTVYVTSPCLKTVEAEATTSKKESDLQSSNIHSTHEDGKSASLTSETDIHENKDVRANEVDSGSMEENGTENGVEENEAENEVKISDTLEDVEKQDSTPSMYQEPAWNIGSLPLEFETAEFEIAEETCTSDEPMMPPSRSMRPTTARRRPPRIKEKKEEPVIAVEKVEPSHIIIEDEDTDFAEVEERPNGVSMHPPQKRFAGLDKTQELDLKSHTAIVQKIVREQGIDEPREEEETKTSNTGMRLRLHRSNKVGASKALCLPTQLSNQDLESLADAIQRIASSTTPFGRYLDGVHNDVEAMVKERNHWVAEENNMRYALESAKKRRDDYLAQLRATLQSLEEQAEEKKLEIQRLERKLITNREKIRKHQSTVGHTF